MRLFADKTFYRETFKIALPLSLTTLLSSCMSIIDSLMVAGIGMVTAVGNASQILTLHDGISWGITSGISVFAAQYYGGKDQNRLTKSMGLSLVLSLINALFWVLLYFGFGKRLLLFYLDDVEVMQYSVTYLNIAIISCLFLAFNNTASVLYRAIHKANLTFYLAILGAIFNCGLNYLFIYILNYGVAGAAIGTLISQMIVSVCYAYLLIFKRPYFITDFKTLFSLNWQFIKPILYKMFPIVINETLFSFASTLFVKAFGVLGVDNMEAYYIANQIYNFFLFLVWGYGGAIAILIGTRLGEGNIEKAKEESRYHLVTSLFIGLSMALITYLFKYPVMDLFNIQSVNILNITSGLLDVLSFKIILRMFTYALFSIFKSGGDTNILNFLDAGLTYLVGIPLAFFLSYFSGITSLVLILLICQLEQVVRLVFCFKRYFTYIWAKDLT